MRIAIEFTKNGEMYLFRAMDASEEYEPVSQFMGTSRQKVIAQGIKSVKKYMKVNDE